MHRFVVRDPQKAYLGTELYLPKFRKDGRPVINTSHIKNHLAFVIMIGGEQDYLHLWHETKDHLVVPRQYLTREQLRSAAFPVVSLLPEKYPHVPFRSKIVLDKLWIERLDVQRRAFAAWEGQGSGIFNISCGRGKTVLALHCIASTQAPALVITEKGDLMDQWRREAETLLDFPGKVGIVQGKPETWDWDQPLVLAMMQTLARYPGEVQPAMRRHFSTVWWDECFVPGTPVAGVPIERYRIGDEISTRDPDTGKETTERVERLHTSKPRALVSVFVAGVEICCTAYHPFWTDQGWVPAIRLTRQTDGGGRGGRRVAQHEAGTVAGRQEGQVPAWTRVDRVEVHEPTSDGTFGGRCPGGLVHNLGISGPSTYPVSALNVLVHNCHHLSAPYFSQTATMFPGRRYGLSATLGREDGMEPVFFYHIGRPIFADLSQDIVPEIYFRRTPFTIDVHDPEVHEAITDKNGDPNTSRLRNYVALRQDRIEYQCEDLRHLVNGGRKILALSHCKEHLYIMQRIFGDEVSGISTGDEKKADRRRALSEKQLVFGTHQLVLEGLDEQTLDYLVWLTPFGSQHPEGGVNALQQGIGRTQRFLPGKPAPGVLIYDDIHIREFHRMCQKLRYQLRRWPSEKGGPYNYTDLRIRAEVAHGS